MKAYVCRKGKLAGTSYIELERQARKLHNEIAKRTKRNPYIRCVYFKKNKVFIKPFWEHLNQKPQRERKKRLQFYACAVELLRHTTYEPTTKPNPNGKNELVHRFAGKSKEGDLFYVQVKEDKRSDNKYLMSIFPPH